MRTQSNSKKRRILRSVYDVCIIPMLGIWVSLMKQFIRTIFILLILSSIADGQSIDSSHSPVKPQTFHHSDELDIRGVTDIDVGMGGMLGFLYLGLRVKPSGNWLLEFSYGKSPVSLTGSLENDPIETRFGFSIYPFAYSVSKRVLFYAGMSSAFGILTTHDGKGHHSFSLSPNLLMSWHIGVPISMVMSGGWLVVYYNDAEYNYTNYLDNTPSQKHYFLDLGQVQLQLAVSLSFW